MKKILLSHMFTIGIIAVIATAPFQAKALIGFGGRIISAPAPQFTCADGLSATVFNMAGIAPRPITVSIVPGTGIGPLLPGGYILGLRIPSVCFTNSLPPVPVPASSTQVWGSGIPTL